MQEQIFLKAILAEFRRAGVEEATVQQVRGFFVTDTSDLNHKVIFIFFGLHLKTFHASTLTCFITGKVKDKLKLSGSSPKRKTKS